MSALGWLPPEPADARAALRRLAGEDPVAARGQIVSCLCDRLGPSLGRLDGTVVTPCLLAAVLSELAYESWLWVMGDRTWEHFAEALAGRLGRRIAAFGPKNVTAGS